jgi:hypothetical protein
MYRTDVRKEASMPGAATAQTPAERDKEMNEIATLSGSKKPIVVAIEVQITARKATYDATTASAKEDAAKELRQLHKARKSALGSSDAIADEE